MRDTSNMATKAKPSNPLHGMHTAGIFSDMSIDGPDIGTLVLIVDRAKNLPNRKTIGKQDPYCAARLGKEAKKTSTDIRGGQTPKWDQELRFTVHDSPDYFQLKLSVFNDDKKTELIGETWIDLRNIIVPGGGQSDQWRDLTCKGKYSGSIRIEITYYDSRPKPEKLVAKLKPMASSSDPDLSSALRSAVKRRPLPSDPVTGHAPVHAPESALAPARAQPKPAVPIAIQPQLQAVEYKTPPPNRHPPQPEPYPPAHGSGYQYPTPQPHRDHQLQIGAETPESFHTPQYQPDSFYQPDAALPRPQEADGRAIYSNTPPNYGAQPQSVQHRRSIEGERPPPPPAHKVRNSIGQSPDANAMHRSSYELVRHGATPPMRHDVLRSEAHRSSVPAAPALSAYPGRPTYRPYESAPSLPQGAPYIEHDPNLSAPRHHSYDSTYDAHRRPMQPTVEDVPESWTPPQVRTRNSMSQYDELEFDTAPNPSPSNSAGHGVVPYERYGSNPPQPQAHYDNYEQKRSPSPLPAADYSQALTHVPRSQAYQMNRYQHQTNGLGSQSPHHMHDCVPAPTVPSTLIPGVDPSMAHEGSERVHQDRTERRYTQPTQMVVHSRGRQHSEPPSNYAVGYSPQNQPPSSRSYERALVAYSGGSNPPPAPMESVDHRRISPSPGAGHTIKRKSVSPAPPPSEPRRPAGVPFGPDSYDAFNPSASMSREDNKSADYTNANGKIVTPDGREIDPSDHLPMDTWAPEPENKKPTQPQDTRSRPVGAQPMPPSGRRQLRIAARPHSTSLPSSTHVPQGPVVPVSTGRNRLQKKNHRAPALPAPISAAASPLSPATAHQRNSTPPRALVRAGTFDYENHGPSFDGDYGVARTGYGTGPPIPAKVPMMSGGLVPSASTPRGGEELALMEEMSRIDIGTGRARRHGRY